MCRADAGDPPRQNLAALRRVRLQKLHIFEVDVIDFVDAKPANLSPLHAARAAAGHAGALILAFKTICAVALVKICGHNSFLPDPSNNAMPLLPGRSFQTPRPAT